jgi:hypothetical protein
MQSPTDQAEASISTATVREGPRLNPMGTFTVRRKAAKRSERWRQKAPVPLSTPARKKPRHREHVPTATDEAARKSASPESLVGLLPPTAADNDDENAGSVTASQPNTCTTVTGRWTLEEDAELTIAVAKCKKKRRGKEHKIDWIAAAALVPSRTNRQCQHRWHDTLDPSIALTAGHTGKWTKDEDLKLKDVVHKVGSKSWDDIASLVGGRTKTQCRHRWQLVDPSIALTAGRTGKWTKDEDMKLMRAIEMSVDKEWVLIALLVPGRTRKQCYRRWRDVLNRSITLTGGRWVEDEDTKLKAAVQTHGDESWDEIAAMFLGRTKLQCYNRWHNKLDPSIALKTGRAGTK